MKLISINAARTICQRAGANRLAIIALDDDAYCITTWGETRAECRALARWAESEDARTAVAAIAGTRAPPEKGIITVANDPAVNSSLGCDPTAAKPVSTLEVAELHKELPLIDERAIYEVASALVRLRSSAPPEKREAGHG